MKEAQEIRKIKVPEVLIIDANATTMKNILLLALLLLGLLKSYSQKTITTWHEKVYPDKESDLKGVKTIERMGFYTDIKTKKKSGPFRMIYAVDTLTHQLVNIVTIEKSPKDHVTVYYFNNGQLSEVITGVKKKDQTVTNNQFNYTDEDNKYGDKDVEAMSANSEKFDRLRLAREYVQTFKKDNNNQLTTPIK